MKMTSGAKLSAGERESLVVSEGERARASDAKRLTMLGCRIGPSEERGREREER